MLKKPSSAKAHETQGEAGLAHGADLARHDVAILRELRQDAGLSNTELAPRIG